MLTRRLATILPAMGLAEALETARIHRVAGLTSGRTSVVTTCPFPLFYIAEMLRRAITTGESDRSARR
jgi:predicted ATPase with chaperone activity